MSARKKIAKLEKKVRKLRTKLVLVRSDLQIELEKELYRANLAETKVRHLTDDLDAFKVKLAVLQRTTPTESNANNTGAEVKNTSVPIAEVSTGASSDNGSAAIAPQAG